MEITDICPLTEKNCTDRCAWSMPNGCRLISALEGIEDKLDVLIDALGKDVLEPEKRLEAEEFTWEPVG